MKIASLLLFFCLLGCLISRAQENYTSTIFAQREKKHKELALEKNGPLTSKQISFLQYFAPNPQFVVKANVEFLPATDIIQIPTSDGTIKPFTKYATLHFELLGKPFTLIAYQNQAFLHHPIHKNYLFLPFSDETNGKSTYSTGRYMDIDINAIRNNVIELDFNQAYNPYCAYSSGYRCPIPPQENHLMIPVEAGEKTFILPKNERKMNPNDGHYFNENDKKIISSADKDGKLRILQTTDKNDLLILKSISSDVKFDEPLLATLRQKMLATVQDPEHKGVGIAAPQIGINKNLIYVQRFDKSGEPFEFYINPKITWRSKLKRQGIEGCLSIPEWRDEVWRSYAIKLQYTTENGTLQEELIEGFTAVIFQHETDHLMGILFPERVEENKDKAFADLSDKINFSVEPDTLIP